MSKKTLGLLLRTIGSVFVLIPSALWLYTFFRRREPGQIEFEGASQGRVQLMLDSGVIILSIVLLFIGLLSYYFGRKMARQNDVQKEELG